jgi:hypothetical protein
MAPLATPSKIGCFMFQSGSKFFLRVLPVAFCGVAFSGQIFSTVASQTAETASTELATPHCAIDPKQFGITPLPTLSLSGAEAIISQYYLRLKVFRVETKDSLPALLATREHTEQYIDFFVFYHVPETKIGDDLVGVATSVKRYGRVVTEVGCNFSTPGVFSGYAPFVVVQDSNNQLGIDPKIEIFTRRTTMIVKPGPFALTSSGDGNTTARSEQPYGSERRASHAQASEAVATGELSLQPENKRVVWRRNFYPWVASLDYSATKAGEPVFALDKISCNRRGNFIVGSMGAIAAPEQDPHSEPDAIPVVRQKMMAAEVNFGASNNPNDEKVATESTDAKGFWCIPTVEFCYGDVDFGTYDINVKQNDISTFKKAQVVSVRNGFAAALARLVMDSCPQEDMEAAEGK